MSESCGFGAYNASAGPWSWAQVFQGQAAAARGIYGQHHAPYHAIPQGVPASPWVQQWGPWSQNQSQAHRISSVPFQQHVNGAQGSVPVQSAVPVPVAQVGGTVKYRLNASVATAAASGVKGASGPSAAASATTPASNATSAAPQTSAATSPESGKKEDGDDVWGYLEAQASFLGPSLWDNGDLKMEYMDLDEFLCENGIPVSEGIAGRSPVKSLTPPHSMSGSDGGSSSSGAAIAPSVLDADSLDGKPGSSSGGRYDADSPIALLNQERVLNDDEESNASEASIALVRKAPAARRKRTAVSVSSSISGNTSDDGSYVPGQDFDPKSRQFSPEELRPQPMSKKSKKQYVPDDMKDDKYWARRRKNNMAAKRSRDARRVKENQIAMRAAFLEKENAVLKAELDKVTKLYAAALKRLEQYEKQGKK